MADAALHAGDATFEAEVLERSRELPVVVDFWAPWCGPCRLIGPILEGLAREYAGRVRLVKVDVDESPIVARQFGISSIPAVMAFRDGVVVGQFVGAVPEAQARTFFESLLPSEADARAVEGAGARAAGDAPGAREHFEAALDLDPDHAAATAGLAEMLLEAGDLERAERLALRRPGDAAVKRVLARVHFSRAAEGADRVALEQRLADGDGDGDAASHYALGSLLALDEEWEAALEHLLTAVRLDRSLDSDGARLRMLEAFDVLGEQHPFTRDYRGRLSSVLF